MTSTHTNAKIRKKAAIRERNRLRAMAAKTYYQRWCAHIIKGDNPSPIKITNEMHYQRWCAITGDYPSSTDREMHYQRWCAIRGDSPSTTDKQMHYQRWCARAIRRYSPSPIDNEMPRLWTRRKRAVGRSSHLESIDLSHDAGDLPSSLEAVSSSSSLAGDVPPSIDADPIELSSSSDVDDMNLCSSLDAGELPPSPRADIVYSPSSVHTDTEYSPSSPHANAVDSPSSRADSVYSPSSPLANDLCLPPLRDAEHIYSPTSVHTDKVCLPTTSHRDSVYSPSSPHFNIGYSPPSRADAVYSPSSRAEAVYSPSSPLTNAGCSPSFQNAEPVYSPSSPPADANGSLSSLDTNADDLSPATAKLAFVAPVVVDLPQVNVQKDCEKRTIVFSPSTFHSPVFCMNAEGEKIKDMQCVLCKYRKRKTGGRTQYACSICKKPLCVPNCYYEFHTINQLR